MERTKAQEKHVQRMKKEIEGFSKIKANWDSYGGKPITKKAIKRATKLVGEIDPHSLNKVEVVPISMGGVRFEWFCGAVFTIDVKPDGSLYIDIDDNSDDYHCEL